VAVIRLELSVDSEVYPELHAALAAIGSGASRIERLRQLAATGLVWETVRIHGAALARLPGSSPLPNAEPAPVGAAAVPRVAAKGSGRTAEKRASPKSNGRASDFVDLALNAVPAADEAPGARPRSGDRPVPTRDIPMLFDVVNPPPTGRAAARSAKAADSRPAALPESSTVLLVTPAATDDGADALETALEGAAATPATGLVHKSVVRSRLLRMKELGLFKNG
jgi:hypothetical protein